MLAFVNDSVFAQNRLFANNSGKHSQVYVGRTQISRINILAPWTKGAQNGGERGCFVTGTMNSSFFVTRQVGVKFRQKTSIGVLYLTLIEEL